MFQKKYITLLLFSLLSVLTMGFWTSCEKYNSESVGSQFYPSNSLVRLYTHPVYVEFSQDGARVWGPYTSEVDYSVDGTHVSLKNATDSLALFVYGYPASSDSAFVSDCNLTIDSDYDFALYINKLDACSQQQPVINSTGRSICYLVLPKGTKNSLHAISANSVLQHSGSLVLTGEGELTLTNDAPYHRPSPSDPQSPVALEAGGGLYCQYDLKLNLICPGGDALRVNHGPMRSSLGTWKFDAGQHAISNLSDSIVLIAGSYTGVAQKGKFFDNTIGAVIRQAKVEGLSGQASNLLDTLILHQRYDSTLVTLQQQFDSLTIDADSAISVGRLHSSGSLTKFTPHAKMTAPWVLLSNQQLAYSDTLVVLAD